MANFSEQNERLRTFIKHLDIPVYKFEEKCGLSKGYVAAMRRGLGHKALNQISEHYPELNTGWLLTGEGEMLRRNEESGNRQNIFTQNIRGNNNHHNSNVGPDDKYIAHLEDEVRQLRQEKEALYRIIDNLSKK